MSNNDLGSRKKQLFDLVNSGRVGKINKARWIAAVVVALVLGWYFYPSGSSNGVRYLTEEAAKGDLVVTVSATGNLLPTNQVDVGSELSGIVDAVLVDENDIVKRGQPLVRLDLSKLNDQVTKSKAAVEDAKAQVEQMQATVKESKANLARLSWVSELSHGKVPSKAELDTGVATFSRAEANEASARANEAQADATLRSDQTNLSKATIRSPINGIVLIRKIEPGQTVAASLQAPVLFTLAEDLSNMQLQVNVDEADVSQVKPGQPARFTVDAWPGRKFPAEIVRVGFGAQTTDAVVTYKTILNVSNRDLSLRPGMTATAEITTAKHEGVLLVPNAALRFTPPQTAPAEKKGSFVSSLFPRGPARPKLAKTVPDKAASTTRKIWLLQEDKPVAIEVKIGLTNGRYTEIVSGELQPGMAVITGTQKIAK